MTDSADVARTVGRGAVIEQARQRHRQGDAKHGIGGGHGLQSTKSRAGDLWADMWVDLRRIAVSLNTNDPQVADRKGNSRLSTQAVDKFVHECLREGFCAGNAGVPRGMVKKSPPHK